MALKPEFISVLRDIRDRIYPEISSNYTSIATWYTDIGEMNDDISEKYDEIVLIDQNMKAIDIGTVSTIDVNPDGSHGIATASYNANDSTLNLGLPAGSDGEKGDTGAAGNDGSDGIQGVTGATGPEGPAGTGIDIQGTDTVANILAKGHTTAGLSWLASDSGVDDDGLAVAIGDVLRSTGAKWVNIGPIVGPQGDQGIQGETGTQGIQGEAGFTGPAGVKGDIGEQGIQGTPGLDGDSFNVLGSLPYASIIALATPTKGDTWMSTTDDVGASIIIGDGINYDGASWINVGQMVGAQGDTGTQGDTGPQGSTGAQGPQGIQGEAGAIPSNLLYSDGSADMDSGYTASNDKSIATKEMVEDAVINEKLPIGSIIMFNGSLSTLTGKWKLCDGVNGRPNLINKFIMGTATQSEINASGGTLASTMPSHTHSANHDHTASSNTTGSHSHTYNQTQSKAGADYPFGDGWTLDITDGNTVEEGDHSHTITIDTKTMDTDTAKVAGDNRPPYYTLAYIIKVA